MARQTVSSERDLTFTMGREELVIHRRYEVLGIVNDFLIGIWFVIGSVCFFTRVQYKPLGFGSSSLAACNC